MKLSSSFRVVGLATLAVAITAVALARPARAEGLRAVRYDTTGVRRKASAPKPRSFTFEQQEHPRALAARVEKKLELKQLFRDRGVEFPATETFLRIFKRERLLEVWVRGKTDGQFTLLKSYPICALAGSLGPKRTRGDNQTPEGFYYIDGFNPSSEYHLSLHIDYPNRVDQLQNRDGKPLGGDIFIHGGCKTEGCLAVTDDAIKELYWLAVEARGAGQERIPVHIFPTRLEDDALFRLSQLFDKQPDLKRFWANLKPTFDYFEANKRLPLIEVDERGRYRLAPAAQQ